MAHWWRIRKARKQPAGDEGTPISVEIDSLPGGLEA